MNSLILEKAIELTQDASIAFSKFITANDVGSTGGHQSGFHIHKNAWRLFFEKPGEKGANAEKFITIKWQNDFETHSRAIYYGVGTRNEYRLTRFGRNFPFLTDEHIGDLLVIIKKAQDFYQAFVFSSDQDIEDFFASLNISAAETNQLITKQSEQTPEANLAKCFSGFLKTLSSEFPPTAELARAARDCHMSSYGTIGKIIESTPDQILMDWLDAEFQLFKIIESDRYSEKIKAPFKNIDELIIAANTILNRRKSRAGKSLEHHLSEIFKASRLKFETQVITENNRKPDFLFPGIQAYNDQNFNKKSLFVLAAKTTCKERWTQILDEAEKIKTKHLVTLQQGISSNQLKEMKRKNVTLVVPQNYLAFFPKPHRHDILSIQKFIKMVQQSQF